MALPPRLYHLLVDLVPHRMRIGYERHSDRAYTIMIQDDKGVWTFHRACLSLDDRWTVSPIY